MKLVDKFIKIVKAFVPLNIKLKLWLFAKKHFYTLPSYCFLPEQSGINSKTRDFKVIVSLTSFPARINAVYLTLWTLLNQEFKPDKIVLWLSREQFPGGNHELPKRLTELVEFGLEVRWCEDIRSYKKLIPALDAFPQDVIVTCDDDVLYPPNWLSLLVESYKSYHNSIHCHRGHTIRFSHENIPLPYENWQYESNNSISTVLNFQTGVGGVLYPPKSLYGDVCKAELFTDIAPTCDDHWFWAMAVLNGVKITIVEGGIRNFFINPKTLCGQSLCKTNGMTDEQNSVFKRLIDKYPEILEQLVRANQENEVET